MAIGMKEKVAIVRSESYEDPRLINRIQEGIEYLGGWKEFITPGDKVLLKPNLLIGRPAARCVNTHPLVVKAVAQMVMDLGCKVIIGDSPQLGSAKKVAARCGLEEAAKELGIEVVDFDPVEVKFPEGKVFKTLTIGRQLLEMDRVINLPKLKTHNLTCLTLAVKNLFGCIPGARKAQWHVKTTEAGEDYLAQLFLELNELIKPAINIVDGIMAMEGRGPGFGDPRHMGLVIMGRSALAVDRVIAEIVSAPINWVPTLRVARAKGYGYTELAEIEMVGETIDSVRVRDFKLPPRPRIISRQPEPTGVPKFLARFLKNQLTSQPVIDSQICQECTMCIEACPVSIISPAQGGFSIDKRRCIQCLCCMEVCPHAAIALRPGLMLKIYNYVSPFLRSRRA
jgi:uncharacterized protein (DUF362 family)/Pyruvate/2-oxoacid:ferredoxin oxidoreductase delta subunit